MQGACVSRIIGRHHNVFKKIITRKTFTTMTEKPLENSMRTKLKEKLNPAYLDVINESYMHNVPPSSETHFKVVVVTDLFEKKPLLQRHRMVNEILDWELQNGIHALSIVLQEDRVSFGTLKVRRMSNSNRQSEFCSWLDEVGYGTVKPVDKAKTPAQWEDSDKTITPSPSCRGGFGK